MKAVSGFYRYRRMLQGMDIEIYDYGIQIGIVAGLN